MATATKKPRRTKVAVEEYRTDGESLFRVIDLNTEKCWLEDAVTEEWQERPLGEVEAMKRVRRAPRGQ